MPAPSAQALDRIQSSVWERLTRRINTETLTEIVLVAVTIGLLSVLASTFAHALQHYRVF
jgi:hypothetical protein